MLAADITMLFVKSAPSRLKAKAPAMNVLPGTIVKTPEGLAVELLGHRTLVHPRHHGALQGLARVDVGLRPQALRLGPARGEGLRGVVFLREPLGLEDEVLVELDGGARLKAVTPSALELGPQVVPASRHWPCSMQRSSPASS